MRCAHGHSFDVAREGYLNLVLANQKRSKEPGDSKGMIRSRHAFLNRGHYDRLVEALSALLVRSLSERESRNEFVFLDAGCGDGFFISRMKQQLPDGAASLAVAMQFIGVDVSRAAIRLAARRDRDVTFIVGSVHNLPVLTASVDCVLSVFAPVNEIEFARVSCRDGELVLVSPGRDHLNGLRRLLYKDPLPHDERLPFVDLPAGFTLVNRSRVAYTVRLTSTEEIVQLFEMTPYCWHAPAETRNRIEQQHELETTVDFLIHQYRKVSPSRAK